MKSSIRVMFALAILAFLTPFPALGGIMLEAEYHLGETGSMLGTGHLPQDSSGNDLHFSSSFFDTDYVAFPTTGLVAPGSTVATDTGPYYGAGQMAREGWFHADFSGLATENFAFGIYARAVGSGAEYNGDVFTLGDAGESGDTASSFKLSLEDGGWRAGSHYVAYIGDAATFTANTWVHLAVIRSGVKSTFYVDGVAQGGTYGGAPVHTANGMLSFNPGGKSSFDGMMDEARVVTFTAGTDTGDIIDVLQNGVAEVPEPSTLVLLVAGIIALCFWRRK